MGSGTKADVVAAQIQHEVNAMAKLPGGPKFVVFGGSMRRTGIPEELGEFKRYLDGFDIPAFAALGSRDLFAGLDQSVLDRQSDYGTGVKDAANGSTQGTTQVNPDGLFYTNLFNDRPKPWGATGPELPDFKPVAETK